MAEDIGFYKDLVDNLYDGVYFVDCERVITYWNRGAERITGYKASQVQGRPCRDNLLNHVTADGRLLCGDGCPLAACMQDGQVREAEVFLHHADGHRVPVVVRGAPMRNAAGEIIGAVETFSSNEGLVETRRQLGAARRTAQTDPVTGSINRPGLEGRLRALLAEYPDGQAGLLFVDVDHFKQVNDSLGHENGDRVLRMVAATLSHSLRATDLVGRWGGDEFIALVYDLDSSEALAAIARKLCSLVAASQVELDGNQVGVTVSVGGTRVRAGDNPESLVARADQMMYQAKHAGRDRIAVE